MSRLLGVLAGLACALAGCSVPGRSSAVVAPVPVPPAPSQAFAAEPPPSSVALRPMAVSKQSPTSSPPGVPTATLRWRFQAAAPIAAAPAVSENGLVYLSTEEGYVHALDSDGSVRWSYGVDGAPLGEPSCDTSGHVYVATSSELYALRADGHLAWEYRAPGGIASAVVWAPPGQLFYAGKDQALHALQSTGAQLWSRPLGQPLVSAPQSWGNGDLAVITEGSELFWLHGSTVLSHGPLPGAVSGPFWASPERVSFVAGGELLSYETSASKALSWRTPARGAAASPDGERMLADTRTELVWLSTRTGQALARMPLAEETSAAPALTNAGVALLPLMSGDLLLVALEGAVRQRIHVGPAALWRPIWSEAQRRVTVAAGSGVVAAIDLGAWPAAGELGSPRGVGALPGGGT